MSFEIIKVHTITNHLTISDEGVKWLEGKGAPDDWSRGGSFFLEGCPTYSRRHGSNGRYNRITMDWSGEGSRDSMSDGGLAKFFSFTNGPAAFVFIDEEGKMFGLLVNDGVMTWYEVDLQLTHPCPPPKNRWVKDEEG